VARIRTIKPELRRSLTVAAWPFEVRYAWVLLLGYLDDYGRGVDDLRLLVADMFPLDRAVTERRIDEWLDLMCAKPPEEDEPPALCRYEVHGRRLLHATKWREHQKINRPTRSKLAPCPVHEGDV
jgi:hypothetical protein